jgi:hypothetical protein
LNSVQRQETSTEAAGRNAGLTVGVLRLPAQEITSKRNSNFIQAEDSLAVVRRLICFLGVTIALAFAVNAMITSGLRKIETSQYGVSNLIMNGKVNSQVIVAGSSRALSHYDPRIIEEETKLSAFNIGRNGSQTDMQIAVLKAYLEHNRKPEIIIHNLDAFSFETTHELYAPAQYVPYLYDTQLYAPLRQISRDTWKSRYVPLYGYVADDMSLSWISGLGGFFGWSPKQDFFLGFNPRPKKWTDEFQRFKTENPAGVSWPVEPKGLQLIEDLIHLCQERGIKLIFVYSPEYSEMQKLTKNRAEIFDHFRQLSTRYQVPLWDYSDWKHATNTAYFTNSQHLNAEGAAAFSQDLSNRLESYLAKSRQATNFPVPPDATVTKQ